MNKEINWPWWKRIGNSELKWKVWLEWTILEEISAGTTSGKSTATLPYKACGTDRIQHLHRGWTGLWPLFSSSLVTATGSQVSMRLSDMILINLKHVERIVFNTCIGDGRVFGPCSVVH